MVFFFVSHRPITPTPSSLQYQHQQLIACPEYGCVVQPPDIHEIDETFYTQARHSAALVTRQSNQHHFNQDRAFLISKFHTKQDPSHHEESFLLGILDGHGVDGHVVAEHATDALPRILADRLNSRPCCQSEAWIQQQLNETFLQVNEELPPFNALRGGCTASVTLRLGTKLYFANAGDSRTLLVHSADTNHDRGEEKAEKSSAVEILYQTRPDKAHLPEEKARIEGLGGKIHIPPKFPNGSRVIVYSAAANPPEPIGLAMSRSLGDWEWKEVGVIAEPIVDVFDYGAMTTGSSSPNSLFLLAASDGIWDMGHPREFFAKRFDNQIIGTDGAWKTAVDLVWEISPQKKEWYRDDMTIIYKPLD